MIFWRKKKNAEEQEAQDAEDKIIHHPGEPEIEPPVEYDADLTEDQEHELFEETETEVLEDLDETPVPEHASHPPMDDEQETKPAKKPDAEEGESKSGWLSRLTGGLSKSSAKFTQGITDLVTKKKLDQDMLDELEELLITADLGPKTAARLVEEFGQDRFGKDISEEEIREALAQQITAILEPVARPMTYDHDLSVILVCGVNGVGKTTTIGKVAHELQSRDGRKVMLAAGDTFRAAAVEQLEIWSQRAGCPLVKKEIGADAAAVAYESYEKAKAEGTDVLFIDTAGRLHNKANLMAELEKIVRVLKKQDESLPHNVLLVLDATTGQNAVEQVRTFKDMVNVTGLIVTKLDGSAKGGIVVSLADQFGLPIHMVGVGEQIGDLQPFNASDFARSLVGLSRS
ncbi:MAG: signal recognition particle-docking protein FtsY [Rhodospirillales bacterium]|nr:signal recognition particle-docking protein FtsY [Rhodospirillales bacterium]MCB9995942.1 signal recognition particle-docking protein FtsY [Rhodospirillales bacterium]